MAVFNPVLCSSALVVAQPRARKRKKIRIEILIGFTDVLRVRSKRSRDLRAYAQIAYLTNPSWSRMRLLRSSSVASRYSSHGRSQRFAANVDDLRSRRFCPSSRFAIYSVGSKHGMGAAGGWPLPRVWSWPGPSPPAMMHLAIALGVGVTKQRRLAADLIGKSSKRDRRALASSSGGASEASSSPSSASCR
jgi:hypothetical protein